MISYINNGFLSPDPDSQQPGYWENKFLSQVDLSKGKIKVKVITIIRQLAPDWSTDREDRKEYLTFNSDWMAKNYLGVNIRVTWSYRRRLYGSTKGTCDKERS